MSDYGNLIASVKKLKPSIRIIVSAILPRHVDCDDTDSMIKAVNSELRTKLSQDLGFFLFVLIRVLLSLALIEDICMPNWIRNCI